MYFLPKTMPVQPFVTRLILFVYADLNMFAHFFQKNYNKNGFFLNMFKQPPPIPIFLRIMTMLVIILIFVLIILAAFFIVVSVPIFIVSSVAFSALISVATATFRIDVYL